jgi:hypothetical protein
VAQDRGWGSRPIGGRDWGTSTVCEDETLIDLMAQFERSLEFNGSFRRLLVHSSVTMNRNPYQSFLLYKFLGSNGIYQNARLNLSQIDFDLEAEDCKDTSKEILDEMTNSDSLREAADRFHLKKFKNYIKKKRISLYASAVNIQQNIQPRKSFYHAPYLESESVEEECSATAVISGKAEEVFSMIFSFLNEAELMSKAFPVCKAWAEYATSAHVNLLVESLPGKENSDVSVSDSATVAAPPCDISWKVLHRRFPWACFLAEGGAKKVYKVLNSSVSEEEAVSVMYDSYTTVHSRGVFSSYLSCYTF